MIIYDNVYELYPDAVILGCSSNSLHETLVVFLYNSAIYLYGTQYNIRGRLPCLFFKAINNQIIIIQDIDAKDNNIGNGSILLNSLLEYAVKNQYNEISGYISDFEDVERRKHFYEKLGFRFTSKGIILNLNEN